MEVELRERIGDVLRVSPLGVLATCGPEGPHTSLVGIAFTEDLRAMFFVTTRSSRKFRNLMLTPAASVLVDDRRNKVTDFRDASAVSVVGITREVGERERERSTEIYLERHPYLRGFLSSPTTALLVMAVKGLSLVTRFQKVMELVVDE
jgi:hypothetical protein